MVPACKQLGRSVSSRWTQEDRVCWSRYYTHATKFPVLKSAMRILGAETCYRFQLKMRFFLCPLGQNILQTPFGLHFCCMQTSSIFLTVQYPSPGTHCVVWGRLGEGSAAVSITGSAVWLRNSTLGRVNFEGDGASWGTCAGNSSQFCQNLRGLGESGWHQLHFPYSPLSFYAVPLTTPGIRLLADQQVWHRVQHYSLTCALLFWSHVHYLALGVEWTFRNHLPHESTRTCSFHRQ